MNAPAIVPPAVKAKNDNGAAPTAVTPPGEKPAKAPKAAKPPKIVDPNAPKKARVVLSFPKTAIIRVQKGETEPKFRGKRADYFKTVLENDGKTVQDLLNGFKEKNDEKGGGPGSWLRWFVDEKLVVVEGVATPAPAAAPAPAETATA